MLREVTQRKLFKEGRHIERHMKGEMRAVKGQRIEGACEKGMTLVDSENRGRDGVCEFG